jgi:hypothetical protein
LLPEGAVTAFTFEQPFRETETFVNRPLGEEGGRQGNFSEIIRTTSSTFTTPEGTFVRVRQINTFNEVISETITPVGRGGSDPSDPSLPPLQQDWNEANRLREEADRLREVARLDALEADRLREVARLDALEALRLREVARLDDEAFNVLPGLGPPIFSGEDRYTQGGPTAGFVEDVLIPIDKKVNVLLGGDEETISARIGRTERNFQTEGRRVYTDDPTGQLAQWGADWLNWVDPGHTQRAVAASPVNRLPCVPTSYAARIAREYRRRGVCRTR